MPGERDPSAFGGFYDVSDVVNDPDKVNEFALSLYCAITGLSVEEALAQEREAEERIARYGPPIEVPDNPPWPDAVECADCGKSDYPFQAFKELLTDVPQHRWVWRYRCMHCYDEHARTKWRAIGRGMRRRYQSGTPSAAGDT